MENKNLTSLIMTKGSSTSNAQLCTGPVCVQPDLMRHSALSTLGSCMRAAVSAHMALHSYLQFARDLLGINCTALITREVDRPAATSAPAPPALTLNIVHLNTGRYSPKSRNCFMERGDGENFEKCSMCLGTLANAAFFMINLTNFIVDAERPGSGKQPRRPIDSAPQSGPAFPSQPPLETGGRRRRERGEPRPIGDRELLFTSRPGQ